MEIQNQIHVTVRVNGKPVTTEVAAGESLLDFLRNRALATEVKCGCNQGDCGTCTVIYNGQAVKSCLVLAAQADGKEVLSLKGLADDPLMQHLQSAFLECGAVQCGFCTPGMLVASWALLRANAKATRDEMRTGISGNLCRCTGYRKILDAIALAAHRWAGVPCQDTVAPCADDSLEGQATAKANYLLLGGG
jgi:aerobic-type carbon monoxide dehydrogenase small subunit (CoxS/CutS family)